MRRIAILGVLALCGCSDGALRSVLPTGTPPPPPDRPDPHGEPPEWDGCDAAFLGEYVNTSDGEELDSFSRWDGALDFGADWWPVDDGLPGDPAGYGVTWTAWLRAWSDTDWDIALGALDVAEVLVDDEVVVQLDSDEFSPSGWTIPLEAGQHRLEVRFAHNSEALASGFSFRAVAGDASICPGRY